MVQRNCSILKSSKVRAFTLLESLIALIVISGGLLLFQAMSQLLISEVRYQQQSEQKEWLLFVDQLEAELERSQFEKVEDNRLYMKQDGKDISIGKSKSDDFGKRIPAEGATNLWFMGLNQLKLQKKINWFAFVSNFKRA